MNPIILRLPSRPERTGATPEFIEVMHSEPWLSLDHIREASGSRTEIGFQWCERVAEPDTDLTLWCDEDGKLKGLEPNPYSLMLCNRNQLAGPVIVTRYFSSGNGDPYGLTEGQISRLASLFDISPTPTQTIA